MSDLTFNKIAGGVLLTGLIIFGLREASDIVFKKHEVEKAGYEIAVQEDSAGGAAAAVDTPPDWNAVLTPANAASGAAVSAKCAACHKLDASNANATGPGLWDVVPPTVVVAQHVSGQTWHLRVSSQRRRHAK